jgi:hypothetical protein
MPGPQGHVAFGENRGCTTRSCGIGVYVRPTHCGLRPGFTGIDTAGKFLRSDGHEPGELRVARLGARRVGEPGVDALKVDCHGGKHVGEVRFPLADVA